MSFLLVIFLVFTLSFSCVLAGELRVTQEHPFLIEDEWIPASDLIVGDVLKTFDGKLVRITNIRDVFLDEPVDVFNLEAGVFHNFVVEEGLVVHNSERPLSPLEQKIQESLGLRPGEQNLESFLKEGYQRLTDRLSGMTHKQLKSELLRLGREAKLSEVELNHLETLINEFPTEGWSINCRPGELRFKQTAVSGETIKGDIKIYNEHMVNEVLNRLPNVREIITAERDMDVLATGLGKDGRIPPVKRTALNRVHFGGEKSKTYNEMVGALERAKLEASEVPEGARRIEAFEAAAKRNMRSLIDSNEAEMLRIWNENVGPYVSGEGNAVFSDVGFRGTMQFWEATMYEKMFPGKQAFVDLAFTKPGGANNAFRGFVRSPESGFPSNNEFGKFFGRHNAEMIERVLAPSSKCGGREVINVNKDNFDAFTEIMLRQWAASNAVP